MEPGTVAPERRPRARGKKELDAEDAEVAGRVGDEFRLGAIEFVSRTVRAPSWPSALGCVSITISVLGGVPTAIIVGLSPYTPTTKLIVDAIIIGLFLIGWPLGAIRALHDVVDKRVAVYAGGVAQLRRGEPEPTVLRWADIETVTIELTTDEGSPQTGVAGCALRGRGGTEIAEDKAAAPVATAAHRALAPRLVPPLLAACDRGEPVSAGDARVDGDGLTMPTGRHWTWPEIKSVTMGHVPKGAAEMTTRIDVRVAYKNRLHHFDPSGVPNAIFFAHALARAAVQNGVQVDGYQGGGGEYRRT
jgi:hypothetical protein